MIRRCDGRTRWNIVLYFEPNGLRSHGLALQSHWLIIRRSSSPSRRRTHGPPETAREFQPNLLRLMWHRVRVRLELGQGPFSSGRPGRYGIVRPTDYFTCIETIPGVRPFTLRTSSFTRPRPFLPPYSIPPSMASAFVLAAASMTAVSLRYLSFNPNQSTPRPNALQAGNFGHVRSVWRANKRSSHWIISRARLRILRKPSVGIVPTVFSSNHLDNAELNAVLLRCSLKECIV